MTRQMLALIDHDAIKRVVEERGGAPATVEGTESHEGAAGELKVHFPGVNDEGVRDISWPEFFEKFEDHSLALLYDDSKPEDAPTEMRFTHRGRIKAGLRTT